MSGRINKYLKLLAFLPVLASFWGCPADTQYTNKITPAPFVAKLNGNITKTLNISQPVGTRISWMGLSHTLDYRNFNIQSIVINGKEVSARLTSDAIAPQFSIPRPRNSSDNMTNMQISITYKPKDGIEKVDKPHKAFLIMVEEGGGDILIELTGYTRGICNPQVEQCNAVDLRQLTAKTYNLKDPLNLYLCAPLLSSPEVKQNTDEANHKDTNLAHIEIPDDFTFYFSADGKTAYIGRSDPTGLPASIPAFDILVPDGIYDGLKLENFKLSAEMSPGQTAACPIADDGSFECEGVELSLGVLTVSPLIISNKIMDHETSKCSSFKDEGKSLVGSGNFDGGEIKLVAYSEVTVSDNVQNLVGALIAAELVLVPAE